MAEWTTEDARWLELLRKIGLGQGLHEPLRTKMIEEGYIHLRADLAAHDAEIRFGERERILGGLLRLPITRTQAWDRGWYSVSITDAISVVRDECCNGRDPGYEGTCPLPLNHQGGCFGDPWVDA